MLSRSKGRATALVAGVLVGASVVATVVLANLPASESHEFESCSVLALNFGRALEIGTGRLEEPSLSQEDAQRLLRVGADGLLAEETSSSLREDARLVVQGAEDAQDGRITDEQMTIYIDAFNRLKEGTECDDE